MKNPFNKNLSQYLKVFYNKDTIYIKILLMRNIFRKLNFRDFYTLFLTY